MEATIEKNADWGDVCRDIENNVRKYVPGPFRWTAKQRNLERDDVYGVCLGQGVCFFNLEEARVRKDDDTYIRELATEILGFPPDSVQDLLRRLDVAEHNRIQAETELEEATRQVNYWKAIEADMTARLAQQPGSG
jgi:hypothetical protein